MNRLPLRIFPSFKKTPRGVAFLVLRLILVPYLTLVFYAFFLADWTIFKPPKSGELDGQAAICIPVGENDTIAAVYLKNPKARYTLLFSHGNAEDLSDLFSMLDSLRQMGYSVFAYDYRGYGQSSGMPTEAHAYEDVDAAYEYLVQELKVSPEQIIVQGRSLGGAMAVDLASRKSVGGLILESAFTSAFRVAVPFPLVPFDKFDNLKKIRDVHCPVLILHGKNDRVVRFWHGEKLFQTANEPKTAVWFDEGGHNNLMIVDEDRYREAIVHFAATLDWSSP